MNTIDDHMSTHASALLLRAQRTRLLANNMANADTPNYKARDFDFSAALRLQLSDQQARLNTTHSSHIPLSQLSSLARLQYRIPQEPSLDGNTVDSDVEQARFAENAVRYQASLHFLNKKITGLISALRGE